jgi:hypothetical protein
MMDCLISREDILYLMINAFIYAIIQFPPLLTSYSQTKAHIQKQLRQYSKEVEGKRVQMMTTG